MGNCNFKADKDKDSVNGTISLQFPPPFLPLIPSLAMIHFFSCFQELVLVLVCYWQGRLRKSLEGREKERKGNLRNEGDVQGSSHGQEERQFSHERTQASFFHEEQVRKYLCSLI